MAISYGCFIFRPRFDNAITLRGNVAAPGRYPWRQGMRVKDLIPSRDALVTQEFWKRQNKLAVDMESLTFKSREEVEQDRQSDLQNRDKNAPANQPGNQNQAPDQYQYPPPSTPSGQNQGTTTSINARSSSGMKTWLHAWAGQKRNASKRNS